MSVTNGSWQVNGIQLNLPSLGQQSLGPFSVAFSDVLSNGPISVLTTSTTIPVPTGSFGVWIIPPASNTHTLTYLSNSGDSTGTRINPVSPSFINFDVNALPANIYLKAGTATVVQIQFT